MCNKFQGLLAAIKMCNAKNLEISVAVGGHFYEKLQLCSNTKIIVSSFKIIINAFGLGLRDNTI